MLLRSLTRRGLCAGLLALCGGARAGESFLVFSAASLKEALDEAAAAFEAASGHAVRISYAGSFALARQIEQGAPAQVFIAADRETMDYAAARGAIRPESRVDLLGNRLVIVTAREAKWTTLALTPEALDAALGGGRLAIGETTSVPAGKYAKAALQTLGLWKSVEARLATTDNVRAALMFVARGEAPLGVVYASDARADAKVKIVAALPPESHPAIVYPAALTPRASPAAAQFLAYLRTPPALEIFAKHGFVALR